MKELDIVILKKDLDGVKKGTQGTIVHDYERRMFEVEFPKYACVISAHEDDLELVKDSRTFSVTDIIAILPTKKEAEENANNRFGYEQCSSYEEEAFVRGVEWAREEFVRRLGR